MRLGHSVNTLARNVYTHADREGDSGCAAKTTDTLPPNRAKPHDKRALENWEAPQLDEIAGCGVELNQRPLGYEPSEDRSESLSLSCLLSFVYQAYRFP